MKRVKADEPACHVLEVACRVTPEDHMHDEAIRDEILNDRDKVAIACDQGYFVLVFPEVG